MRFGQSLHQGFLAVGYGIDFRLAAEQKVWSPWIERVSRELLLGAALYGRLFCLLFRHRNGRAGPEGAEERVAKLVQPDADDFAK